MLKQDVEVGKPASGLHGQEKSQAEKCSIKQTGHVLSPGDSKHPRRMLLSELLNLV